MEESSRFYELLEKLFKEIDQQSIEAEVQALREAKSQMSRQQLADHLTKKAAVRVATVGAAAGITGGRFSLTPRTHRRCPPSDPG